MEGLAHGADVRQLLHIQLDVDDLIGIGHLLFGGNAKALDTSTSQLKLEPPDIELRIVG